MSDQQATPDRLHLAAMDLARKQHDRIAELEALLLLALYDLEQLKQEFRRMAKEASQFSGDLHRRGHHDYARKVWGRSEAYSIAVGKITRLQRRKKA